MEKITKNDIKTIAFAVLGIGAFVAFAQFVPDNSIAKKIATVVFSMVIGGAVYWFWLRPAYGWVKNWIAKFKTPK